MEHPATGAAAGGHPESPAASFMHRANARGGTQVGKASAPETFESEFDSDSDEDPDKGGGLTDAATVRARRKAWITHDSGQQALATLGTSSPHVTLPSLIYLLVTLL